MSNDPNKGQIHGLVLFKSKHKQAAQSQVEFSLESVDQENKIKLLSQMAPFGADYRYSIIIANQSLAPATEIKVKIKFPSFLELARISPPNIGLKSYDDSEKDVIQINLEFDELDSRNKKQIDFYFNPKSLNNEGEIATFMTFVNNKDFVRVLNSNPVTIIVNPIALEPKIIPSYQVGGFLQKEGIHKAIKSIGLGTEEKPNFERIFNNLEQIIRSMSLQLIARDEEKLISWFFGTELESREEVLVIGQIIQNKIEVLAASRNNQILISILSKISEDLIKRIISSGFVSSKENIHELECKYCGAILPYFPIRGEAVRCKNCKHEQEVW